MMNMFILLIHAVLQCIDDAMRARMCSNSQRNQESRQRDKITVSQKTSLQETTLLICVLLFIITVTTIIITVTTIYY
jgi:hypothetical protein